MDPAVVDDCGVCDGPGLFICDDGTLVCDLDECESDGCDSGVFDCEGVCDGTAVLDCLGNCESGSCR